MLIYNLPDSNTASSTDLSTVCNLFNNSDLVIPFDYKKIKVSRLGKSYCDNKSRPLLCKFETKEDLRWTFTNKIKIFKGNIKLSNDFTKEQREYYNKLKSELSIMNESSNVKYVIKNFDGIPKIVKTKQINSK